MPKPYYPFTYDLNVVNLTPFLSESVLLRFSPNQSCCNNPFYIEVIQDQPFFIVEVQMSKPYCLFTHDLNATSLTAFLSDSVLLRFSPNQSCYIPF